MRTIGERMYTAYCYYSGILGGLSEQPKEAVIQADIARRYGFLCALLHFGLLDEEKCKVQKRRIPRQAMLSYSRSCSGPAEKLFQLLGISGQYLSAAYRQMTEDGMIANFFLGYLDAVHLPDRRQTK